jgi:glycosyltransferase involved in cell wall biosynthesis
MPEPLVSVVIPTYKCSAYICQAIESVLSQTYRNVELIIIDGSPDTTKGILKPYLDRITYVSQEPRGVSAARNLGLQHVRGTLVAFQDADDIWLPDRLSMQVHALQKYPEAALVFSDLEMFDESEVVESSARYLALQGWFDKHRIPKTDLAFGWIYHELLLGNCIGTCTVLVRREVLDEVGMFDETLKTHEDYELWLRMAVARPVLYVGRILARYRVRPDGLSGPSDVRQVRWRHDQIAVREKHLRNKLVPNGCRRLVKDIQSWNCWDLAWGYFVQNRLREARAGFLQGLGYRPFHLLPWLYLGSCFLPAQVISAIRRIKRASWTDAVGPIRW